MASVSVAEADQFVNGYVTKNGTYVAPHYRSNSDGYSENNYSYKGNVNPYNGTRGSNSYTDSSGTSCSYSSLC